jgi:hypothetical protein
MDLLAQDKVWWRALVNTAMNIYIKDGQFMNMMGNYQLLKKYSTPWGYF